MLTTDARHGLRAHLPGLVSLALASCLAVTTEMLPIGLLPAVSRDLGVTESATGLTVSLYATMVAALAVPLTLATARFPRKPLLLITVAGYALSNTIVALAPEFVVFAAGRFLGGVTHALFFSLCIGYTPRLVGQAQVGRALALVAGGASAGFVLGVPLSTSLGTAAGWRFPFGLLAALAVVTFGLVTRLLPAVSNEPLPRPAAHGTGRRQLVAVTAANALTYLGQFTVYTFISVLLLAAGAAPALVGPILLACGACGLIGLAYAGRTLDHDPRRATVLTLAIVIVAVTVLGFSFPVLAAVTAAAAVWNGAFGGVPSIFQACALRTHAVAPELAGAWVNATANLGIGGGAAIGAGVLELSGVSALPAVSAALIAVALAVVLVSRRAFPSRAQPGGAG
ncbi:MAG: MFS transporter [Actinobacteria bacterium]|nr:MFS transporter [Actinomycetota bacterium]